MATWALVLQGQELTDSAVAQKLGITVQQVDSLREHFAMSDDKLLALSPVQLEDLLWEIEHPEIEFYAEALKWRALRMKDEHGNIAPNGLRRALEQRKRIGRDLRLFPARRDQSSAPDFGAIGPIEAGIQTYGWTWLGPGNVGGRVRSILVHPTSTNFMWCGSVSGGIWKTTNSGAAWFPLDDFMANLSIGCMAMDPANPNVIYAGTGGDYYTDAVRGAGIFKTTDAGNTWTQLASTTNSSFYYVNALAIDPNNSSNILATTRSGIFRSTDSGASWTQRTSGWMLYISYHPTDSSQAIASGWGADARYSTDGGLNWVAATGIVSLGSALEVAYSPSSPETVFTYDGDVYRSTDDGQTYSHRGSTGQNGTPIALWCDPVNTNIIVVGTIDLYQSANAGAAFTRISDWTKAPPNSSTSSVHADHHIIVHNPAFNGTAVKTVFFGNDGGVYRAADVYTVSMTSGWLSLNNNLGITQFYGGAGNSNTSVTVGGTQDNGTLRYTTGGGTDGWTFMFGGDGGFCAADNTDPNYFYGEYIDLRIHRSSNGGVSSSYIYSGITDASQFRANFIAPFILDPNNANTMLAGGSNLWRSTNVKTGPTWTNIKSYSGSYISAIAVAPGNSDVIWVGHNNGAVYSTTNGTAGSPTWTLRASGMLPARYCGRIAIAPGNPNRVYAVFGGFSPDNVWRTSDGGLTWSNITGNLPAAPMSSIIVSPLNTNAVYVGSEVGVFGTPTGDGTWSTGNDGPANVAVDELFWLGYKLVAVTHGRGMFSIIPDIGNYPPVINAASIIPSSPTTTNDLFADVSSASDFNGDPISFAYQWQESATNLIGQTSSNLPAAVTFVSGSYRCAITPTDSQAAGPQFTTTSVVVLVDADGNGVNNDWEFGYFGQIGINQSADADNDGQINLTEFLAGTDPTNSASYWSVQASPTNGVSPLTVSFSENSTGTSITNRLWDFGDGDTGSGTNPSHTYTNGGTYSIGLTIYNLAGSATLVTSNLIAVVTPLEEWQLQYFGCTNCPQAATTADPDGDGQNNLAEFLSGFDPTNSASVFRIISVTVQGANTLITWATAGGKTNLLQGGAGDLDNNDPIYSNLFYDLTEPIAIPGNGSAVTNFLDDGSWWGDYSNWPAHYYRIRLVP